ncbi:polysaccharide deacetylase family protein [Candidatus Sumerlaeota bacterium]|nr:polysaccharide deacetylase family protein [Candidatus Sumerlaeota bacterium]
MTSGYPQSAVFRVLPTLVLLCLAACNAPAEKSSPGERRDRGEDRRPIWGETQNGTQGGIWGIPELPGVQASADSGIEGATTPTLASPEETTSRALSVLLRDEVKETIPSVQAANKKVAGKEEETTAPAQIARQEQETTTPTQAAVEETETTAPIHIAEEREDTTASSRAVEAGDAITSLTEVVLVEDGDNLPVLARRYDTKLSQMLYLNPGLQADAKLLPGTALRVLTPPDRPPTLPELSRELRRGVRGHKRIALTFDAAWTTDKQIDRLLDALTTHGAKATFFLTGIFLDEHPGAAKRILDRGFPIHNHTAHHRHSLDLSDGEIVKEILSVDRRIVRTSQRTTRPFWRPPYGERDKRVLSVAARAGFRSVYWTIDSLDWMRDPPRTPEMVFERVCKRPFEKAKGDPDPLDGAIVLFHIGGQATADALDLIVPYLREKGYRFVLLPELLEP